MKANDLTSGEASSFQSHSRNIPDGALSHQVMSRTAVSSSHTTGPHGGPNGSLGRVARPANSGREVQPAVSGTGHRVTTKSDPVPSRLSRHVDTEPCELRAASGQGQGHTRWQHSALPMYIVGAVNKSFRRFSDFTEFRQLRFSLAGSDL